MANKAYNKMIFTYQGNANQNTKDKVPTTLKLAYKN